MSSLSELEYRVEMMSKEMSDIKQLLAELKSDVKYLVKTIDEQSVSVTQLKSWRDGELGTPGVNTRIDRLERFMGVVIWVVSISVTTAIGALTMQILQMSSEK